MITQEHAKYLLEKWKCVIDHVNNPNKQLATAILIESQEEWVKPISNAPVAQLEERSPD